MMRLVRFASLFSILAAGSQVYGQALALDSSGDNLLNGKFYFRDVVWQASAANGGALSEALALYDNITFTPATGTYTMSAHLADLGQGTITPETYTGTYAIGAGGFGYISHPYLPGVQIRGMVSNGIFIGSATENGTFNDLFIAAGPLPSTDLGLSSFNGSYAISYVNYSDANVTDFEGAQFTLSPNGAGKLGSVSIRGYYAGNGSTVTGQVSSGLNYSPSHSAMVISFPTNSSATLVAGNEYLYQSPDGNFVFGGSPQQADFFVGVRTTASGAPQLLNGSLYYNAGIYSDATQLGSGYLDLDSYYGSFSVSNGTLIQHSRIFDPVFTGVPYSSVSTGTTPTTAPANGTYSDPFDSYTIGNGGNVRIGFGIPPYLGLDVALAAPNFKGDGVYLNPVGVENAASYAPFTAGISPGELLLLTGTNLAPNLSVATTATFPTTGINNVQVLIDGISAPLYYVSPTQIAAIVPFATSQVPFPTGQPPFATIQVSNGGVLSNKVTEYMNLTTPGVFTSPVPNGISDAAAVRYDASGNGSIVTERNPAQPGDTVAVYLTGLGAVFPLASDGAPGSSVSTSLNNAAQPIAADIGGVAATVGYAGLAPGFAGLYQLNITVPTGLTAGDNYLDIQGPDSFSSEALIPIGSGAVSAAVPAIRAEVEDGQTYKSSKHRKPQPLKKPIVVKTGSAQ
jgi:uncharacterized protein (TIGR03437 family)